MAILRSFCHFAGMTEKVVLALIAKRAEIQGYIQDLETKARRWRTRLAHVDAAITIFSPDTDPQAIQPKRGYRRSQYFRGGEFSRLCLDVLRDAWSSALDRRRYRWRVEGQGIT